MPGLTNSAASASKIRAQRVGAANDIVKVIGCFVPLRRCGTNFKAGFTSIVRPSVILNAEPPPVSSRRNTSYQRGAQPDELAAKRKAPAGEQGANSTESGEASQNAGSQSSSIVEELRNLLGNDVVLLPIRAG